MGGGSRSLRGQHCRSGGLRRFSEAFGRWRQLYRERARAADGGQSPLRDARTSPPPSAGKPRSSRRRPTSRLLCSREARRRVARTSTPTAISRPKASCPATTSPGCRSMPMCRRSGGGKGAYLQRARFLAIAEFGPRSLIYHEGRAYRVYKAKLPPGIRDRGRRPPCDGDALRLRRMRRRAQRRRTGTCHACNAPMGGIHPIRNVLRIDNVETQPAERITANDEDRQRQGFDIQTVFAWPQRDGGLDVTEAVASDDDGPILSLAYAPGATISRLNKGLRRRKEKSILGFGIDPATGRWTGSQMEGDDDATRTSRSKQRVVPIVQDHKNALLLRLPRDRLSEDSMATLQHALARGLEIVFQLEEGEMSDRACPCAREPARHPRFRGNRRRRRRAWAIDERSEGTGAGRADGSRADALPQYRCGDRGRAIRSCLSRKPDARCVDRAATAACSPTTTSPTMS